MRKFLFVLSLLLSLGLTAQQFHVSYPSSTFDGKFSGKVYLYFSKDNREPREGAVGMESFPCFAVAVHNLKPGSDVVFDDKAVSYPVALTDMERGDYYVQAVFDRNLGGRSIAESPGNLYSKSVRVRFTHDFSKIYTLRCDQVNPEPVFKETEFVKELRVPSKLLSEFLQHPVTINAAVILPKEYFQEPGRKFPVLFQVSGYGGDYHRYSGNSEIRSRPIVNTACITVFLDGNCPLGHSVYANSANNGPWGDALTREFIPALESKYRCNGARLLQGHSSGGWTVLWLQTHYPKVFSGCWSSSPDPVDFRNFQHINFYKDKNMFYDADSNLRNVATVAGAIPWVRMHVAYQMEHVIDRGEQMHSFDAVFGAKGANGQPERICNESTGEISRQSFEHWKPYDISLYLRSNWVALRADLNGKIRVSVGEQDNFLLNGAVHELDKAMKELGADMQFEYFPGDHFTVFSREYMEKGMDFLAGCYRNWQKKGGN